MDLCYAAASAHNRMMTDFCSVDRRLLATAYVPLADIARAPAAAREAIDLGAKALLIPSRCPKGHSPSHVGFDPVWAMAQEAGLPILFHVGGERKLEPGYFENGMPRVKDFRGLKPTSFDGRGNYAMGLKEHLVFPEINYDEIDQLWGMDIVVATTAKTDEEARALLKEFQFPFTLS